MGWLRYFAAGHHTNFSMLTSLPQPVIFAHRGASAHAPENTIAAFALALEHNADAIELDVKLSADGQAIVIHDAKVDRTTGSHGRYRHRHSTASTSRDPGLRSRTRPRRHFLSTPASTRVRRR